MLTYDKEINHLEKALSEIDGIKDVRVKLKNGEIGQTFQITYYDKGLGVALDFDVEREAFDTYELVLDYCKSKILNNTDE